MQDIISTLKNALQQAEAGLEVAVGRLAKDDTERGDFKPSEVLALACVREALAMPVSCLHQIQEPAAAEQAAWHAGLDEGRAQAAPAAVAVPDLQDMLRELRAQIHWITTQLQPTVDCSGVWMAHDKMSAALAATPAAAVSQFETFPDAEKALPQLEEGQRVDIGTSTPAAAAPVVKAAPLDALRWGANVAETLLSIGRAIGFGRAQQILGEQWEAEHNCAPRGRMGVTVKDDASAASSVLAAPLSQPVVLPEPVGAIAWNRDGERPTFHAGCTNKELLRLKLNEGLTGGPYRTEFAFTEPQLRALLATGGQAQAVRRGEVLVTVSGFTGSGKSAIAGEIEILCRALGLQVEWPDGESEKNMTHADWTAALEQYKPRVRIVEQNIPFVSKKGLSK